MLRFTHLVKGVGIKGAISQELVTSAVELVRAGSGNDIYLTAAGASISAA